jgi:hypothetical protein
MPLSSVLGAQSLVRPGVCTSTTRPASPFEGQVIYETDTDLLLAYNGSAWRGFAEVGTSINSSILQVVQATKTDTFTSTSTTLTDITGMSVSITPTSTTSKVLVTFSLHFDATNGVGFVASLLRGATEIFLGDAASTRRRGTTGALQYGDSMQLRTLMYLDSPATTSATTYKLQARVSSGSMFVNRTVTDTDGAVYPRTASSITVMEVSA